MRREWKSYEKKTKQVKKIMAVVILGAILVTGCGKKEVCDFCNEKKACTTKEVLGEKIKICEECFSELSEE